MILYYLLAMTDDSMTAKFQSLVNYDSYSSRTYFWVRRITMVKMVEITSELIPNPLVKMVEMVEIPLPQEHGTYCC